MGSLLNLDLVIERMNLPLLSLFALIAAFGAFIACGGKNDAGTTIKVMAASSLTEAFQELAEEFEAGHPGDIVRLEFGGSQRLRSQLAFGAEADVFASADHRQMDLLLAAGLAATPVKIFAENTMTVIASAQSEVRRLEDLVKPDVRLVLAQTVVPAGVYSHQMLKNLAQDQTLGLGELYEKSIHRNLVSEESNVRGVGQKVALAEADAGVVYRTDVPVARNIGDILVIETPSSSDVIAEYPIATLTNTEAPELAHEFVAFVLSDAGRSVLSDHGFAPP